MRRAEALRLLAEHRAELAEMGAGSLSLFGSVARDGAGPDSDVDVLIELDETRDLFDLAAIHLRLEEIFGCRVDVATEGGMKPRYRERIDKDLIPA